MAVGSKNPTKILAVQSNVDGLGWFTEAVEVPSLVSAQPFSDFETRQGAINRASACVLRGFEIGFGLEGGVVQIEEELFLCNWGALVTKKDNQRFVASGAKIHLPVDISTQVTNGTELGDVMAAYTAKQDVRKKEGAVGIFTDGWVTREEMFTHIVKLLVGQYQFYIKNK